MSGVATNARRKVPLARAGEARMLLGVCGGLARWAGIDPAPIRVACLLGTAIGGVGVAAYAVAAVALEDPPAGDPPLARRARWGQMVAIALLAGGIVAHLIREATLADPGTVVPASLLVGGVSLLWRRTGGAIALGGAAASGHAVRVLAGLALVIAGALLFAGIDTDVSRAAAAAIAAGIVAAGSGLIFAPRLAATRAALEEARRQRIRAEERETIVARIHDSVLQTLAMIQRDEGGGSAAALARRQERELRSVLYGDARAEGEALSGAMNETVARIEARHGIVVELVQTRDVPLADATEALVAATGEAITNAAKHAGVDTVSVTVRIDHRWARVFVRDRGTGFDPTELDGSGRGIVSSIRGRIDRVGGTVAIDSAPGSGTEVEIGVPIGEGPT